MRGSMVLPAPAELFLALLGLALLLTGWRAA